MRKKVMSIIISAVMVVSISASMAKNVGEPSSSGTQGLPLSNISAPKPQIAGQPSSGLSGSGGLADSPWPMFRHNLNRTGLSPHDTSGNLGNLKWSFETGHHVISSPAINFDGTIYVGSDDKKLYAIHPNGTKKWNFMTDSPVYSSPAIGFDGTIYVGSHDHNLYAIKPDGTEKWSFKTNGAVYSSPGIGSDGTIYVGSFDHKLYAVNSDGTEKWNFTTGGDVYSSPAIGSDGTIYVGSCDHKLYAINPDGTEKWNFIIGNCVFSSPAISSEGMIYVGSNANKLHAINPDGTEKWNFTTINDFHSSPTIGPDGTIYIGSDDIKLYAIGTPTSDITVEKTANITVASPGDLIEYTIYYNNTATVTVTSAGSQQLTFEDYHQYTADISVDGTKILYSAIINLNHDIWIMDIDGTNHQQLTFESYLQREPSYSPDGTKIVYSSSEDGGGGYEDIWVMDSDGGNHVQLTSNYESQRDPKFSPDGSKIIYASKEDGVTLYDIWIMDSDGSNKKQLTFENNPQACPVFSPDGMKIAYQSWEAGDGFSNIWIMDSDGSNHQQLTFEGQSTSMPRFSPNGNWIVYTVLSKIYIVDINGNNKQLIDDTQGGKGWALFDRSGNKLFYSAYEAGGGFLDIWTLDLEYSNGSAHTVWINDTLPPGTTFITSSAEANRTGDYNWTFYNVEPGEHHFTITVQVNNNVLNGTILTNYVHLDYTIFEGIQMPRSLDSVDVLVLAPENQPPIANAGPDQIKNEGDVVKFNGSMGGDGATSSFAMDIVLTLDSSGSMNNDGWDANISEWQPIGDAKIASKIFVDILNVNDRAAVYDFDSDVTLVQKFTTDKQAIKDAIDDLQASGLTKLYDATIESIKYAVANSNNTRMVIVLTDGRDTASNHTKQDAIDCVNDHNETGPEPLVYVFTIGLGSNIDQPILQNMSTKEEYYYFAPNSSDLKGIYAQIAGDIQNITQAQIISYEWDFESDGIYDYVETTNSSPDGAFDGKTSHVYGDNGVYTVTLRITDDVGLNDTDTCNVTVNNVAPMVGPINTQAQNVTEEWVARYNGPENLNDALSALAIDSSGNIYVTGKSHGRSTLYDYATIKYDSSGNKLWVARYNSPKTDHDEARAIAVDDSSGNVYVTGESLKEYTTVAYDSSGKELWVAKYSGNAYYPDNNPSAIAIGSSGIIYVTGTSWGIGTYYDFATIAYDPFGKELWVARYDDPRNWAMDGATAIAVDDSSGNIYVTGSSGLVNVGGSEDYVTVAYDSSGNELWVAKYNGPGNDNDAAFAIAVASSGIIYVTGVSTGIGTLYDYTTVAYDSLGNELWVARYDGPINDHDIARSIALDLSGNIYITGSSFGNGTEMDYATVAYNSLGNELWVARYNGLKNDYDEAQCIDLDSYGNVYVTGYSFGNGTHRDYATIAYDSSGHELWVKRYNGPGNHSDAARAIALDSSGNVYLAGSGYGNGTGLDYTTIKYSSLSYYEYPEGSSATFTAIATDPGSDDLTFTWNWGDGTPDTVTTYYNDGTGPEPVYDPIINEIKSPWGTYPFKSTDTVSHIYGDDGVFTVTLTVEDDDGGISLYKTNITVSNVNPTVTIKSVTMDVEIGLRVAGRKYNNVSMILYEDGNPIGNVSIERMPGSPNEQMAWIPVSINFSKSYSAIVTYTPEDPPNVGANPVWIYIKSKNGSINKIHHTFNVQQSKKRDSDHWNHVEPWEVDLNPHFIGLPFEITSHITDPGSDDETLTFTYGSQVKTVTYLNNPPNPDPYPSPEVKPMDIKVTTTMVYEGSGTVTLVVKDDDNIRLRVGQGSDTINVV